MKHARANPGSPVTNQPLVAPLVGQYVTVERIYVTSDAEIVVSLTDSEDHDLLWKQYVGKNGGSVSVYDFESNLNEGLDLTTAGNGNLFILVSYHYSGAP